MRLLITLPCSNQKWASHSHLCIRVFFFLLLPNSLQSASGCHVGTGSSTDVSGECWSECQTAARISNWPLPSADHERQRPSSPPPCCTVLASMILAGVMAVLSHISIHLDVLEALREDFIQNPSGRGGISPQNHS